jgi:hypothetical protein
MGNSGDGREDQNDSRNVAIKARLMRFQAEMKTLEN